MAGTGGRTSRCNSVVKLLQMGGHLARRHRTDLTVILWLLSAVRTLALSRVYTNVHHGGARSRFLLIIIMKCIWKQICFSEAPSLVPTSLSRCNLHHQGPQQGSRGSMLCSKEWPAKLGAAKQLHVHGRAHNQSQTLQIWVIPRQVSAKSTRLHSR